MTATIVQEDATDDFVAGNYFDKYRSGNPIHQRLMGGFLKDAHALLRFADPANVLEVGCGPGDLVSNLLREDDIEAGRISYLGTDVSLDEIENAKLNYPCFEFQEASIYELPFDNDQFDFVLACEVLEHLESPATAIAEVARVTSRFALFSVPWEPVWRLLNVARGKYLTRLGNTPGHLQNFSRTEIRNMVSKHFKIVEERHPLPWTMLLAEVKTN